MRDTLEEASSSEEEIESDDGVRSVRSNASSLASRRQQRQAHNEATRRHRSIMSILTNAHITLPSSLHNEPSVITNIPDFSLPGLPGRRVQRRFFGPPRATKTPDPIYDGGESNDGRGELKMDVDIE